MDLASKENEGREGEVIAELLDELAELRELDRRRQDHAPGSVARDVAALEVELRSRRLMDRVRDLRDRNHLPPADPLGELRSTRELDPRSSPGPRDGARLN